MAIRKIELLGSPVLREPAREVERFDGELETLVQDMLETMYHARGIGLAAPQVGISLRVLVVDPGESGGEAEGGPLALVNPRVEWASREVDRAPEGCLSIPGVEEVVERPWAVRVQGFTPRGEEVAVGAAGLLSRTLQHEIDHLDGILFPDRISPLKRKLLLKKWQRSQAQEVAS